MAFGFREMQLLLFWVVVIAAATAWRWPGVTVFLMGFGIGFAVWIFAEYMFHRFVLHLPRPPIEWMQRLHARIHWQHHQTPDAPEWLFVPWWGAIFLLSIAAAFGGMAGAEYVLPAMFGYGLVFLHYEIAHLAAHVPYRPRTLFGNYMRRHHLLHHFKNERYWYGVTNPLMDYLWRTWPEKESVPKSDTARTLGVEPEAEA